MTTADDIIRTLDLELHPEGGYFREVYRDGATGDERGVVTSIYFLLKAGDVSRWHRVDAVEIWHFYDGAPLELSIAEADDNEPRALIVGKNLSDGERPVGVVPKDAWQSARSLGAWTLVGCTVSPAFEFSGFEMAPEGWMPNA
jgi:predicted cupin superfamily sugar epimerase